MYYASIRQMSQMLTNLSSFLDAGAAFAEAKKFDVARLLNAGLAPDMFNLIRQVQAAADAAKFAASRLSGKDAPVDPDTETTVSELKARLAKTIDYLATFEASDFNGASERVVTLSYLPAPVIGHNYFVQMAQPNFYFHAVTAYAILRHNGVELGKQGYIGKIDFIEG